MTGALTLADPTGGLLDPELTVLATPAVVPGNEEMDRFLAARGDHLIAIRRHIHSHPELSGQEYETAALVFRELAAAGLNPKLLPRGNGVLCDVGRGDRAIALRADLDALPLPDAKDVPYRSTVENVCHACGHDVHTTILIGAALALAELDARGELPGRVRLIFQPSEEKSPWGGPEVIRCGGLDGVDAIFALHCYPQFPAGTVGVRPGPFTAAADTLEIRLTGPGGHTARPHLTADLVNALGRVLVDVPALLARKVDPRAGVSMVFGAVRAGEAANTIPSDGYARATVRALSSEAWQNMPAMVTELVHNVVAGTGAEAVVDYTKGVPPVINDRLATAVITDAAVAVLGAGQVVEAEASMGGEDFAFYLQEVPGAMIRLGTGFADADGGLDIHQSGFDIDERAIGCGVRVFVHTVLAALSTGAFSASAGLAPQPVGRPHR